MAEEPGGEGTPGGTPAGFTHAALIQKGKEKEKELLDRLKEFFVEKGQPLEEGWRVEVKIRSSGTSLGTTDAYYFSPAGKRYRSRMEIARDLGVVDEKEPKSGGGGKKGKKGGAPAPLPLPEPIPRDQAVVAARKHAASLQLPKALSCGVTVTNLGSLHPTNPAYCNPDRLWPAGFVSEWEDEKGVRFVNSITETPSGPMFRLKAQRLATEGRPATEIVELGAGPTPDDAYRDAEERQNEALEIALLNRRMRERGPVAPGEELAMPAGRALDAAEHLLVRTRPLGLQWGLERFGLADPIVLHAIEGLPGADLVPGYTFVEEKEGGWVAAAQRLNAQLAAKGKKEVPVPVVEGRRVSGEGTPGAAARKRPPRPSRKEAEENAVKRVLDGVIKHIEMEEMKNYTVEQKLRMKLEKQAERDRKRADRDKMTELQRLQQKAAYIEAQRRQAELNATVEDCELPAATEPPPEPGPIAAGRLPLAQQAVLLEAWQFVSRFGVPLLKLPEGSQLPTLQQLEAALLGESPAVPPPTPQLEQPLSPAAAAAAVGGTTEGCEAVPTGDGTAPPPPDAAVQLQMALVDFLIGGLFQETAQAVSGANSDISLTDLRGPSKGATHPLAIKPDTWQEAARRYLTVLATSAMTQAKDGGAPGSSSPLAVMDPWVILQYLTAGPPSSLAQGAASLPRGAAKTAGHAIIARSDAAAVAAAEHAFAAVTGGALSNADADDTTRLLRCLLKDIIHASKLKKGDARVLCYGGQAAAAAAKVGRPLDLKCVAARIDAGVYTALPDPLAAFAADVKHVATLYQAGCNKPHSLFAQEYLDKAAPELAALAVSKLEQSLRELQVTGAADYISHHAPPPNARRGARQTPERTPPPGDHTATGTPLAQIPEDSPAVNPEAEGDQGDAPACQTPGEAAPAALGQRAVTDAVRDLDRPFAPFKEHGSWQGCVVCWSDDDPTRLLACDTCDCRTHSYCLVPPLEELPLQTEPFLCQRCRKRAGPGAPSGGKPPSVEFARASGGDAAWRLAQLLATTDYSEWGVEDRCALLRLLCSLCAESAALHDTLHGEEDEVRDKRKEINSLKAEVKRMQAEMQAAQQQQQAPAGADAAQAAAGSTAATAGAAGAAAPPAAGAASPPQVQRQSRRGGRDPAAEIEGMVERISKLEHDIAQVGPVRLEPVGLDRHYNRYWLLPAEAAAPTPAHVLPSAPPVLVIEKHRLDSVQPASTQAVAAALAAGQEQQGSAGVASGQLGAAAPPDSSGAAGGGDSWQVGLYANILQLQLLAQWLNPKGTREKPLSEKVRELLDGHQQFAMLLNKLPPRALPPSGDVEMVDPAERQAAALSRLQQAMLSFEEGNQAGTYDELAGAEGRRQQWRAMVGAASTPQALMSALLVLEGMVRPEFLKPHWRPFALPAPQPNDTCTLPAVWLRLEALKASVRLKVTISLRALGGMGGALGGGQGTRYSLREPKPLLKRSYYEGPASGPGSRAGSDSEGEDGRETRAERAAKRAKQREAMDDETLARELDAELNAGTRRTRGRLPSSYTQQHGRGGGGEGDEEAEWEEDGQNESLSEEEPELDDADASP